MRDKWFRDGSVGPEKANAGVYRGSNGISYTIPMESLSNFFQAELIVINHCADNTFVVSSSKVINILSYCKDFIHALNSEYTKSELVWDCFDSLNSLANNSRITLLWIPSHSGFRDNDITDVLARLGSRENFMVSAPVVRVCRELQYRTIMERTVHEHQKFWEALDGYQQARGLIGTKLPCKWRKNVL